MFFQISLADDAGGKLINEKLHLTVRPFVWWQEMFSQLAATTYFSVQRGQSAIFYVSARQDAEELTKAGSRNVEEEGSRGPQRQS